MAQSTSVIQDQNQETNSNTILRSSFIRRIKQFLENQGFTNIVLKTQKSDDHCGTLTRIQIEAIDGEGGPNSFNWISKSAAFEAISRKIIRADALYAKEVYMYKTLLPRFHEFEEQKGISTPFDSYPPYILSHSETDQENFIMLDMKSIGFKMKNEAEALDYNHVAIVVQTYAKLHAISYVMKDQSREDFNRIKSETADVYFCRYNYERNYREQLIRCLDHVEDANILAILELFLQNPNSIVMDTIANINDHSVVIHGDPCLNNILFKYDDRNDSTIPTEVCLLDFQLARIGSPIFDLSCFIFTCTDKQFRDEYYDDMIELYFSTLHRRISEFGSDPQELIPFDIFVEELKRYSVVGFYLSTIVLNFMLNSEWIKADDSGNPWIFKTNDSIYRDRLRGIIIDVIQKGYLDFLKK